MEEYGYAPLQSGYAGAEVGDLVPGREEGTPVFEGCKAQGSCCSSDDVASELEAVFENMWNSWEESSSFSLHLQDV